MHEYRIFYKQLICQVSREKLGAANNWNEWKKAIHIRKESNEIKEPSVSNLRQKEWEWYWNWKIRGMARFISRGSFLTEIWKCIKIHDPTIPKGLKEVQRISIGGRAREGRERERVTMESKRTDGAPRWLVAQVPINDYVKYSSPVTYALLDHFTLTFTFTMPFRDPRASFGFLHNACPIIKQGTRAREVSW